MILPFPESLFSALPLFAPAHRRARQQPGRSGNRHDAASALSISIWYLYENAMTKLQITAGALVVTALGAALVLEHQAKTELRDEVDALRQRLAQSEKLGIDTQRLGRKPRLPAPPMPVRAPSAEAALDTAPATNLLAQLLDGGAPKLGLQQVEAYLEQNHRNAESLLAAFRTTGDPRLLREALKNHPNDPRVHFAAYFAPVLDPALGAEFPPEERQRQLEALQKAAPDNALPNYLSAFDCFKAGQTDQAVRELAAAAAKPQLQDYSLDFVQGAEEAYRAAGYSVAQAKAAADFELPIPQFARLKRLSLDMADLVRAYRQAGDETSAQATLQIGLDLGRRLDDPRAFSVIQNLVGTQIQGNLLATMEPGSPCGDTGQTVQNQLDALAQRTQTLRGAMLMDNGQLQPISSLVQGLSESDLISFLDRMRLSGTWEATQWARNRQQAPAASPNR